MFINHDNPTISKNNAWTKFKLMDLHLRCIYVYTDFLAEASKQLQQRICFTRNMADLLKQFILLSAKSVISTGFRFFLSRIFFSFWFRNRDIGVQFPSIFGIQQADSPHFKHWTEIVGDGGE